MASSSPASSLVLLALRGIDSDQVVDSIGSREEVDEAMAKLKELKGLLKRRRSALAVRMEDLVLPVRRLKGKRCWLKVKVKGQEEEEEEDKEMRGLHRWECTYEAAFTIGPGLAQVVCTVETSNWEFKAELSLKRGGLLWKVDCDRDSRDSSSALLDLDGAALQLLEASQVCSWTTTFLGSGEEAEEGEEDKEEGEEEEEGDSHMGAPDAARHDLAHSTASTAPDAAPHLHVWPVAPAANAATPAAAAADARKRRALVRRFLADVSAEVLEQMCGGDGKHNDLESSLEHGMTSVQYIEQWIMTGGRTSWRNW